MKIFISWSKHKSKLLATATKTLIENALGKSIQCFFSPEMYKGTRADNEIHENLLSCDKCLVCITSDNFKNPWLLYEAGMVFGANHTKTNKSIVIPILFEYIPDWSSWIDKPLNQYVPIQMNVSNKEFASGKQGFKEFLNELALESGARLKNFEKHWTWYEKDVQDILKKEQLIPDVCKDITNRIMEKDDGSFSIVSPEITSEHVLFHKGFATTKLTRILLESIMDFQGKRLWLYGRRNKRLLSSENNDFFQYLAEEGIANGVNFRCLFPYPESEATQKATSQEKERSFNTDLQTCMEKVVFLKNKYQLPIEKLFRVYSKRRTESIIIIDNAVIYKRIVCDGYGYPLPYTNSDFEILGISENASKNKGYDVFDRYQRVWDSAIPFTEELYKKLYQK